MFDKHDNKNYTPGMNAQQDLPTTVSASRIAAMLGMDSRCSPLSLFLRMRGELDDDRDNEAMLQGRFYERATCDVACHKYGMEVVEGFEQTEMVSGALSGHPDFLVKDEHGKLVICEVKNPFFAQVGDEWGDPGTDEVPRGYFIQSMVYLHLFREAMPIKGLPDLEVADYVYVIARLRGGVERYKVPYDRDIISRIEADAAVFLHRVRNDDPPEPKDEADLRNRWAVTEGKKAACSRDFLAHLANLQAIKKQIKDLTQAESELKAMILAFAQDSESIEFVDEDGNRTPVVTLKADRQFDAERCLADHPELISKGFVKLDASKLSKEQKALHEMYMTRPEQATKQKRVIRLQKKKIEALTEATGQ